MSVRDVDARWPLTSTNQPVALNDLGHATGNAADYVLVSFLSKRLFINSLNDYVVFVTNGQNVTEYEWTVSRYIYETDQQQTTFPANSPFSTIQQTSTVGLFTWTPAETGRYKVEVKVKDGATILTTLALEHTVFETIDSNAYIAEARSVLLMNNQPDNPALNMAGIDLLILNEIGFDLWEYITRECVRDPNNLIPPNAFVTLLFHCITRRSKVARNGIILAIGTLFPATVTNQDIRSGYIAQSLGVFDMTVGPAAMVAGFIPWHNKTDLPGTPPQGPWTTVEATMNTDFNALGTAAKTDLFNLLRFPKSAIKIVGDLIRRQNIQNLPAASRNLDISKYFIRYTSFNDNLIDDARFNMTATTFSTEIPFLSPLFLIRAVIPTVPAINLQFMAAAPATPDTDVIALKNDLTELGFAIATEGVPIQINTNGTADNTNTDGYFNLVTEWAVKEFQIYAKMGFVAKVREGSTAATPYHQRLRRYPNLLRYTGPISGVANPETRELIKLWKLFEWRCPVVVSAFSAGPAYNVVHTANVWRHDFVRDGMPRFFVQDYSGYWGMLPDTRIVGANSTHHDLFYDGKMSLGTFTTALTHLQGIANSSNAYCWQGIHSNQSANITAATGSTVNVLRSVILREAGNNFEVINSWDNAFLSWGYFHWTIGTRNGTTYDRGELQGFLTYFKLFYANSYKKCMLFFGLNTYSENLQPRVTATNPTGSFDDGQKKHSSHFMSQNDSFGWNLANAVRDSRTDVTTGAFYQYYGNHNYHRTWHSFYRWVMALRILVADFRQAMWNFGRMRIRDLQNTQWGIDTTEDWKNIHDAGGNATNVTFGDVIRSERAWALILRWHVNRPAHVVSTNVSDRIKTIFHFARCGRTATTGTPATNVNVDTWISDNQTYLAGVLSTANNATVIRNNLANAPALNGNPFDNPNTWTTANMGIPNQTVEDRFCKALILYIRDMGGQEPLKTSMGLVYQAVTNTQQNFALDVTGLP